MERTRFSLQTDGRTEEQSETSISRPLIVVVVTGDGRGGYFEKLNAWIIGTILLLLVWLNHNWLASLALVTCKYMSYMGNREFCYETVCTAEQIVPPPWNLWLT